MQIIKTILTGVLIIKPKIFKDERGFFKEAYSKARYQEKGIENNFVQDNHSCSQKNVLRGLHFQKNKPQGKLVSCTRGAIYDVVVDIDPTSKNFGNYFYAILSEENHFQLWVPPGYAHGFCVLTDIAEIHYKCTEYYDSCDESGLIWNDPDINIDWPIESPILSEKDSKLPKLTTLTGNR